MNDGKPSREWTCIVYLNEDFSGGETYFPPSDYYPFGHQTEQEVGSGLLFQGIHHAHGVFKVRRGQRHTIAIWFTEDQQKCDPTTYSTNLDLNENTIKEHLQYDLRDQLKHIPKTINFGTINLHIRNGESLQAISNNPHSLRVVQLDRTTVF